MLKFRLKLFYYRVFIFLFGWNVFARRYFKGSPSTTGKDEPNENDILVSKQ
jgi:hypothetical protein